MEQLPEDMKAVVCHGPRDYRFEKITRPVAQEKKWL